MASLGAELNDEASRSHASHWNRGNRITGPWNSVSFLYISVIQLSAEKYFGLEKKHKAKNTFLQTRTSVNPDYLFSFISNNYCQAQFIKATFLLRRIPVRPRSFKNMVTHTLMPKTLFWFRFMHGTWVADGTQSEKRTVRSDSSWTNGRWRWNYYIRSKHRRLFSSHKVVTSQTTWTFTETDHEEEIKGGHVFYPGNPNQILRGFLRLWTNVGMSP